MAYAKDIDTMAADVYRYLSFDQIAEFPRSGCKRQYPGRPGLIQRRVEQAPPRAGLFLARRKPPRRLA